VGAWHLRDEEARPPPSTSVDAFVEALQQTRDSDVEDLADSKQSRHGETESGDLDAALRGADAPKKEVARRRCLKDLRLGN
jgi:hypothetical protein